MLDFSGTKGSKRHVWTSTYEVIPSVFGNIRLWCMRNFVIVAFIGVSIYWDIHIGAAYARYDVVSSLLKM